MALSLLRLVARLPSVTVLGIVSDTFMDSVLVLAKKGTLCY